MKTGNGKTEFRSIQVRKMSNFELVYISLYFVINFERVYTVHLTVLHLYFTNNCTLI